MVGDFGGKRGWFDPLTVVRETRESMEQKNIIDQPGRIVCNNTKSCQSSLSESQHKGDPVIKCSNCGRIVIRQWGNNNAR